MSFKVIKAGFMSSIQDLGRYGYGDKGLAQSGAADCHAFCWANYLLGNTSNAAQLEITFGGCELLACDDMTIAVTGADFDITINGKPQHNWQTQSLKKGDVVNWSTSKRGVRAYLAVEGGFQTEAYFGSRSVNVREHIGRLIQNDDELVCASTTQPVKHLAVPHYYRPNYDDDSVLRLLPSYQYKQFSHEQLEQFFKQNYTIELGSDRTGCRLTGTAISDVPNTMISEGMAYGTVEITSAGLPIILLNDQPTIGGYPKIGTVFSLDLAKLAQRHAGGRVRFELIDIEQAQQYRVEFNQFFGLS